MSANLQTKVRQTLSIQEACDLALSNQVNLVRFLYCDTGSVIRGKSIFIDRFVDKAEQGIGLVKGSMAQNLLDKLQSDTGLGATGEIRLVPDISTFSILPYSSNSASVICDLIELNKEPWAHCRRSLLKRMIAELALHDLELRLAFETEFYLGYPEGNAYLPIDHGLCFSTESMHMANDVIQDIIEALKAQNIEVEQYYPELGPGQHELSIKHKGTLEACDRHIMLRETIRGVSLNYGLKASLAPKPFAEQAGSGCHLHFSLWDKKTGRNITAEDASGNALSAKANNFLAGILNHLEAIVAISCASVNSYRRLRPQSWSSAFAFWGYENREAALRIPSTYWGVEAESANVELKCVDASSNPYLLLAAVIAAGLDGISHNLQLGEPYAGDPAVLTPSELKERGIRQLPHNLEIALEYLEKDKVLCAALGEDLIKTFIRVKRSECVEFQSKDIDFELENHRFKF